ncbi:MAG: hypothetical protein KAG97_03450 [Victivallales bacterium]|nr:hypothetical protein [Victivallales bacterium]
MREIENNHQSLNGNFDYRGVDKKSKRKGCFFWGCASLLVILLIAGLCVFLVYRKMKNIANEYTSLVPVKIESVRYAKKESVRVNAKVAAFMDEIKKGSTAAREEFTDRELNIYIASHEKFKNSLKLDFSGDKIKSALNIPLNKIPMLNGRYLVGDAEFKVDCRNGDLNIKIVSLNVNGKDLPPDFAKAVQKMNFADNFYNNPASAPIAKRIKTIELRNHKLFIEVNPKK